MKYFYTLLLLTGGLFGLSAQDFDTPAIVKRLASVMNRNYVYPDKGEAMSELILSKLNKGEYDELVEPKDLADQLESDLRSIIYDKHIRVKYDPERRRGNRNSPNGRNAPSNYGFEEAKILDGNIGYLDLRGFANLGPAEDVAKSAMDKLIQADAIIFDLRKNGGGSPSMIRFISSYIFGDEPVHLNTFYWRPSDNYSETWTNPEMASQNKPNIPIYVLTSNYTFSAAEEFTYNLKHLERATIIGETTGGGAHPGGPMTIKEGFYVNVPQGRAINPVTETNWEGVGVVPHIQIPAEDALDKAIQLAQKSLASK